MTALGTPTGEVTLSIAAPPEEVWALVTDVTRIGEFSPETFEGKWTRGSTGPEVGASFAGHVRRNGVGPVYWSPCHVTVCQPPTAGSTAVFEFAVGTDSVSLNNWGYRIATDGVGGSTVTEYFQLKAALPMRIYWLLLGWSRGRTNARGMRTTLERMKAVLEP